jgi:hypothetical protein
MRRELPCGLHKDFVAKQSLRLQYVATPKKERDYFWLAFFVVFAIGGAIASFIV